MSIVILSAETVNTIIDVAYRIGASDDNNVVYRAVSDILSICNHHRISRGAVFMLNINNYRALTGKTLLNWALGIDGFESMYPDLYRIIFHESSGTYSTPNHHRRINNLTGEASGQLSSRDGGMAGDAGDTALSFRGEQMAVMGRVLGSILTDSTAPVPIQPGRGLLMLSRQYVALGGRTGFAERTMTTDRVMHSDEDAIIPSYQDVGMYAQIVNQFGVLSDQEDGTYTYTPIETGGLGGGEERPDVSAPIDENIFHNRLRMVLS